MVELFFDVADRVLLIRYGRSLGTSDLRELDRLARGFVALRGQVPSIIDASGVTHVDVPTDIIRSMASIAPVMGEAVRVYVAPMPELFGLLRLYATLQESAGFKPPALVHTVEEARRVLNLTDPYFTPYLELTEGPAY